MPRTGASMSDHYILKYVSDAGRCRRLRTLSIDGLTATTTTERSDDRDRDIQPLPAYRQRHLCQGPLRKADRRPRPNHLSCEKTGWRWQTMADPYRDHTTFYSFESFLTVMGSDSRPVCLTLSGYPSPRHLLDRFVSNQRFGRGQSIRRQAHASLHHVT